MMTPPQWRCAKRVRNPMLRGAWALAVVVSQLCGRPSGLGPVVCCILPHHTKVCAQQDNHRATNHQKCKMAPEIQHQVSWSVPSVQMVKHLLNWSLETSFSVHTEHRSLYWAIRCCLYSFKAPNRLAMSICLLENLAALSRLPTTWHLQRHWSYITSSSPSTASRYAWSIFDFPRCIQERIISVFDETYQALKVR